MSKMSLIEAVRNLDVDAATALLTRQPTLISTRDPRGLNLLQLTCAVPCAAPHLDEASAVRMAALQLDAGVDVNSWLSTDGMQLNTVWFAVARGRNAALVNYLVKRGATPMGLLAASWHQDIDMLECLIDHGVPVDEEGGGETPFLHAWTNRKFESVTFLVAHGANVNIQDAAGRTALHIGIEKQYDPDRLQALVRQGASPEIKDQHGVTARGLATRKRDKRYLQALSASMPPQ